MSISVVSIVGSRFWLAPETGRDARRAATRGHQDQSGAVPKTPAYRLQPVIPDYNYQPVATVPIDIRTTRPLKTTSTRHRVAATMQQTSQTMRMVTTAIVTAKLRVQRLRSVIRIIITVLMAPLKCLNTRHSLVMYPV